MKTLSPVPLACSTWGDEELKALQDVIDSGRFTMGPKVAEFEKIFADYHDSKYCVMVNSGSSANFLIALKSISSSWFSRLLLFIYIILQAI